MADQMMFDMEKEYDHQETKCLLAEVRSFLNSSYASAIEKCLNVYNTQKRRRSAKFKELTTVDDIRDELRLLFGEIIANYIIAVLFDALY